MKTLSTISSAHWQPELGTPGSVVEGLADLGQAVKIILLTPKGSDPHRPEFGSDIYQYIDWPVDQATPYLVREATEAIKRWEPRIEVVAVNISIESSTVTLRVVWKVANGIEETSEVVYERAGSA